MTKITQLSPYTISNVHLVLKFGNEVDYTHCKVSFDYERCPNAWDDTNLVLYSRVKRPAKGTPYNAIISATQDGEGSLTFYNLPKTGKILIKHNIEINTVKNKSALYLEKNNYILDCTKGNLQDLTYFLPEHNLKTKFKITLISPKELKVHMDGYLIGYGKENFNYTQTWQTKKEIDSSELFMRATPLIPAFKSKFEYDLIPFELPNSKQPIARKKSKPQQVHPTLACVS